MRVCISAGDDFDFNLFLNQPRAEMTYINSTTILAKTACEAGECYQVRIKVERGVSLGDK